MATILKKLKRERTPSRRKASIDNIQEFSISDFNVLSENGQHCFLGKGSFASVFKSVNGKDGKIYALKIAF